MAELTVPKVDFAPLGDLPQLWKQGRQDAMRQQTLSSLGQGTDADVNALLKSGDLSLAQLGVALKNRNSDDIWRQQEAQRTQKNADRSYSLQEKQFNASNEGPEETAAQRAAAARSYGVDPNTPAGKSYILTGKLPEADTSFQTSIEQRKQAAVANGLDPSSPGFQSFVLTGKMPREDAQPLTATDKKAILEADEMVLANRTAIDALNKAKVLSKQAFSGPMAAKRGYAASFLGESSDIGKAGIATTDLENTVTSNALGQLKTIFGGNPTEGERKIMLDIQGSASQPDSVRQKIFDRATELAQKRLEFNQKRADELRGNQYYKPQGIARAPMAQTQGITQAQYEALPSGTPFTAPDGTQRVKP